MEQTDYNPKGIVVLIEESDIKIYKKWISWLSMVIILVISLLLMSKYPDIYDCRLSNNRILPKSSYYYNNLYNKYN